MSGLLPLAPGETPDDGTAGEGTPQADKGTAQRPYSYRPNRADKRARARARKRTARRVHRSAYRDLIARQAAAIGADQ